MSGGARTRIKICGITTVAAAEAAVAAGADAIGLVRVQESPRCVDERTCGQILGALPPLVSAVGVYRNAGAERLREPLAARFALLQLHGDEDEQDVAAAGRPVFRGFAFSTEQALRWDRCPGVAALLLDGPAAGSGRAFDHAELAALRPRLRRPIILAGGLTPENVAAAIAAVRPYAVDVSSGVESSPGVKDPAKIEAFCEAVRGGDGESRK